VNIFKYFITFHIFGRADSVMTATRAGHKTVRGSCCCVITCNCTAKIRQKSRVLSRRANISTVHLLVLIPCQCFYKQVLTEDVRSII